MPSIPPRPCRAPMCSGKTTDKHGYCELHAHLATGWNRSRQGKSGRGGRPWRRLRAQVLERDRWLCKPCEREGRATPAAEVDHILNKAAGGDDSAANLESICRACHQVKTLSEAQAARSSHS